MTEKAREDKLSAKLHEMGFILEKSHVRHTNQDDYGGYMIRDGFSGHTVEGERFQLDLDYVEQFVSGGSS